MRASRLSVALLALALAAGCFPTGPSYEGAPAPSSEPKIVPGRVPDVSYQVDYSWRIEAGWQTRDYDDDGGNDVLDTDLYVAHLTWYPGHGIADDDTPYALQPFLQRSPFIRGGFGIGEFDINGAAEVGDTITVDVSAGYIEPESGFGINFSTRYEEIDEIGGAPSFTLDEMTVALVYQTEGGLAVEAAAVKSSSNFYIDDISLFLAFWPWETSYRGLRGGVRKVFTFGSQALDISGSFELGEFNWMKGAGDDDGAQLIKAAVTYYPAKTVGLGATFKARTFDSGAPGVEDREHTELGGFLTITIGGRVDLTASYTTFENDITAPGDVTESQKIAATLAVRF